ncbi:ubiquitin carboxyl-terminal hydrolase faf-x-related [Anaeramoeba flamelloides]|uniref:Ubiquitin carboxyl-terminal hydrolase faf-x-related n=1 Tax=Anaeramoeba flamelloides TaxID=1746091 RepID=A0AAV7YR29_9EUKA|nr:ubiquitin carboxyl-terminal hydrolase faf-x-related [Anaeramoeba flamelloides]
MTDNFEKYFYDLLASLKNSENIVPHVQELNGAIDNIINSRISYEQIYFLQTRILLPSAKCLWERDDFSPDQAPHVNRYFQKCLVLSVIKMHEEQDQLLKLFSRIFLMPSKYGFYLSYQPEFEEESLQIEVISDPIVINENENEKENETIERDQNLNENVFKGNETEENEKEKEQEQEEIEKTILSKNLRNYTKSLVKEILEKQLNKFELQIIQTEALDTLGITGPILKNDSNETYYTRNIDFFAKIGGFRKIFRHFLSLNHQINGIATYQLLRPVQRLCCRFNRDFVEQIAPMTEKMFDRLLFMKYDLLKREKQKDIDDLIAIPLTFIRRIGVEDEDVVEEKFRLDLAEKYLYSPNLELRVKAMNYLNHVINKLELLDNRKNQDVELEIELEEEEQKKEKLIPFSYITNEVMINWIENFNIIDYAFGIFMHEQIIKRIIIILKFLVRFNKLSYNQIEKIFDSTKGLHTSYLEMIYEIISSISGIISNKIKKRIFENNIKVIKNWDPTNIKFLEQFTLSTFYNYKEPYNFLLSLIYTQNYTNEIQINLRNSCKNIFSANLIPFNMKQQTLEEFLNTLSDNKNVFFILPLIENLIRSFPEYNKDIITRDTITNKMNKEYKLITLIIEEISNYKTVILKHLGNNDNKEITLQDLNKICLTRKDLFIENYKYFERITVSLNLIKTLTTFSKKVSIEEEQILKIWEIFIENSIIIEEQNFILDWIMTLQTTYSIDTFLFNKIQTLPETKFNLVSFKFFKHFGYYTNELYKYLKGSFENFIVNIHETDKLYGYEKLWNICLNVKDGDVLNEAIKFLLQFQNFNDDIIKKFGSQLRNNFIKKCFSEISKITNNDDETNKNTEINNNTNRNNNINNEDDDEINNNENEIQINKGNELKIIKILNILLQFIQMIEKDYQTEQYKFERHSINTQKMPLIIKCYDYTNTDLISIKNFKIKISSNKKLIDLKLKISKHLNKKLKEFRITTKNDYYLEKKKNEFLNKIDIIEGTKINIFKPKKEFKFSQDKENEQKETKKEEEEEEEGEENIIKILNNLMPSYLLQNYFQHLFKLLEYGSNKINKKVWQFLMMMPSNENNFNKILNIFNHINTNTNTKTNENENQLIKWDEILNSKSLFKLIYNIQLILNFVGKSKKKEADDKLINWVNNFLKYNGLEHLLKITFEISKNNLIKNNKLKIQALSLLLNLIGVISIIEEPTGNDNDNDEKTNVQNNEKKIFDLLNFDIDLTKNNLIKENITYKFNSNIDLTSIINKNPDFIINFFELILNSSFDNDIQNVQQNNTIIKNSMSLIIAYCFNDYQNNLNNGINKIKGYFNLKNWIINILIKSKYSKINQNLIIGLYQLNKLDINNYNNNEKENSIVIYFLKLLLTIFHENLNLISIHKKENENENENISKLRKIPIGNFLNLISLLINLIYKLNLTTLFNFGELFPLIINLIKNRPVLESNKEEYIDKSDETLIGLFHILYSLILNEKEYRDLIKEYDFIEYLFFDCLFQIPMINDYSVNINNLLPKCKTEKSIVNAYQLLVELIANSKENYLILTELIKNFHSGIEPPRKSIKNPMIYGIPVVNNYIGLSNLGATCYLNSFFQQLFNTPKFRKGLLSMEDNIFIEKLKKYEKSNNDENYVNEEENYEKNKKDDNFFFYLQCIFGELWKSDRWGANSKDFCDRFLDWDGNPINPFIQMDVYELLTRLFDKVEDKIKSTKQNNFIEKTFVGKVASQIIGIKDPHFSERLENFYSISLDVIKKKNVYESLDQYIEGDMLTGDNKYFSDKLGKKIDVLKRTCIHTLPENLILHLKRFEFDMNTMQRYKVNDHFEFPMELNMYKFTREGIDQKQMGNTSNEKNNKCYEYDLVGILVHLGSALGGHYYSFIKERETRDNKTFENNEGNWYKFDDSSVTKFSIDDIPEECFGGSSKNRSIENSSTDMNNSKSSYDEKRYSAYMLFYQRKDVLKKQKTIEEKKFIPSITGKKIFEQKLMENLIYVLQKKVFNSNYFDFILNYLKIGEKFLIKNNENIFLQGEELEIEVEVEEEIGNEQKQENEEESNKNLEEEENKEKKSEEEEEEEEEEKGKEKGKGKGKEKEKEMGNEEMKIEKEKKEMNKLINFNINNHFMEIFNQFIFKIFSPSQDINELNKWMDYFESVLKNDNNLIWFISRLLENKYNILFETIFFYTPFNELRTNFLKVFAKASISIINKEINLIKLDMNQIDAILKPGEEYIIHDEGSLEKYEKWFYSNFNTNIIGESTAWHSTIIKLFVKLLSYLPHLLKYWKNNIYLLQFLQEFIFIHPLILKFFIKCHGIIFLIDFNLYDNSPLNYFNKDYKKKKKLNKFLLNEFTLINNIISRILLNIGDDNINNNNKYKYKEYNNIKLHSFEYYMILESQFIQKNLVRDDREKDSKLIIEFLLNNDPTLLNKVVTLLINLVDTAEFWGVSYVISTFNNIFNYLGIQTNEKNHDNIAIKKNNDLIVYVIKNMFKILKKNSKYKKATLYTLNSIEKLLEYNPWISFYILNNNLNWLNKFLFNSQNTDTYKTTKNILMSMITNINNCVVFVKNQKGNNEKVQEEEVGDKNNSQEEVDEDNNQEENEANLNIVEELNYLLNSLFQYLIDFIPSIHSNLYKSLKRKKDLQSDSSEEENKEKKKKRKKALLYPKGFFILRNYFKILTSFFKLKNNDNLVNEFLTIINNEIDDIMKLYKKMVRYQLPNDLNKKQFLIFWSHCFNISNEFVEDFLNDNDYVLIMKNFYVDLKSDSKEIINYNNQILPIYFNVFKTYCKYSMEFKKLLQNSLRINKLLVQILLNSKNYYSLQNDLFSLFNILLTNAGDENGNNNENENEKKNENENSNNEDNLNFQNQFRNYLLIKKYKFFKNYFNINTKNTLILFNQLSKGDTNITHFCQCNGHNLLSWYICSLITQINIKKKNVEILNDFEKDFENLNFALQILKKITRWFNDDDSEKSKYCIKNWNQKFRLCPLLLNLVDIISINEKDQNILNLIVICLDYCVFILTYIPENTNIIFQILSERYNRILNNFKLKTITYYPTYFQLNEHQKFLYKLFRVSLKNTNSLLKIGDLLTCLILIFFSIDIKFSINLFNYLLIICKFNSSSYIDLITLNQNNVEQSPLIQLLSTIVENENIFNDQSIIQFSFQIIHEISLKLKENNRDVFINNLFKNIIQINETKEINEKDLDLALINNELLLIIKITQSNVAWIKNLINTIPNFKLKLNYLSKYSEKSVIDNSNHLLHLLNNFKENDFVEEKEK